MIHVQFTFLDILSRLWRVCSSGPSSPGFDKIAMVKIAWYLYKGLWTKLIKDSVTFHVYSR